VSDRSEKVDGRDEAIVGAERPSSAVEEELREEEDQGDAVVKRADGRLAPADVAFSRRVGRRRRGRVDKEG